MKKIYLTGKRGIGKFSLIDDDDFEKVNAKKWSVSHLGRAKGMHKLNGKWKYVFMHRFIMNFPDGQIDHKNGDCLDNRKENLRICDRSQNGINRPPLNKKYKGVRQVGRRFEARIKFKQKDIRLGSFKTEIEAAKAYNEAAKKYFGEFAWLNPV